MSVLLTKRPFFSAPQPQVLQDMIIIENNKILKKLERYKAGAAFYNVPKKRSIRTQFSVSASYPSSSLHHWSCSPVAEMPNARARNLLPFYKTGEAVARASATAEQGRWRKDSLPTSCLFNLSSILISERHLRKFTIHIHI